jgi:hypothetical protein
MTPITTTLPVSAVARAAPSLLHREHDARPFWRRRRHTAASIASIEEWLHAVGLKTTPNTQGMTAEQAGAEYKK